MIMPPGFENAKMDPSAALPAVTKEALDKMNELNRYMHEVRATVLDIITDGGTYPSKSPENWGMFWEQFLFQGVLADARRAIAYQPHYQPPKEEKSSYIENK